MIYVRKYDKTKTYCFPNGEIATPERVSQDFPAAFVFTSVITTDESEVMFYSFDLLSSLRTMYNIDSSLSEDEAIVKIQEIKNKDPESSSGGTPEERTATALEAIAAGQSTENSAALNALLTGEE